MKHDIRDRKDITLLVDTFYHKVKKDTAIGHIFSDIVKVDWDHHLPVMYSFWSSLLLDEHSYSGNPMATHAALNKTYPLLQRHFDVWIQLFHQTVDELFYGPKASEAKSRGLHIAQLMHHKMRISEVSTATE